MLLCTKHHLMARVLGKKSKDSEIKGSMIEVDVF